MLRSVGSRLVLSAGVVAIAATLAGLSTWAQFTDSTSATHSVSTGSVELDLGAAGTADNRLDVPADNLAPGDVAERAVTLTNSSSIALASVTLTTSAVASSLLDQDPTSGLQVAIERCPTPWSETFTLGVPTYTCASATTVLSPRPIAMTNLPLANVSISPGGGVHYLRVRTSLPAGAGNAFQGLASDLSYTFTGVQRSATSR